MRTAILAASATAFALAACNGGGAEADVATVVEATAIPESLAPFGDGYPLTGAPCRQLGESEATSNWLDDSAVLVGCPDEASAEALGGTIVTNIDGVRIVSVPLGDANAGMGENGPPPPRDEADAGQAGGEIQIRGANSLESRCADRVAQETGARVIGTNRIEESEAAIEIYVNLEGATAPWRCLAYRDGTIGEVMFTGDEGAL